MRVNTTGCLNCGGENETWGVWCYLNALFYMLCQNNGCTGNSTRSKQQSVVKFRDKVKKRKEEKEEKATLVAPGIKISCQHSVPSLYISLDQPFPFTELNLLSQIWKSVKENVFVIYAKHKTAVGLDIFLIFKKCWMLINKASGIASVTKELIFFTHKNAAQYSILNSIGYKKGEHPC